MFDLVTERGIVICRGIGCVQISDQQGNVIELDYDEVSQIGAKLAFARLADVDEEPFALERPSEGKTAVQSNEEKQ